MSSAEANVFVGRVDRSDPAAISEILAEAVRDLGLPVPSRRRILVHPACPWAHRRLAPHSFAARVVVEGVVQALAGNHVVVGTHAVPGVSARYALREAGYEAVRGQAALVPLDEYPARGVDGVPLPDPAAAADLVVAVPHLTGSAFSTFAGAIRHHMFLFPEAVHLDALSDLPRQMLRLLGVRPPDLIVLDALTVLHRGGELAGDPLSLSVLVVGTNPVAVDVVGAVLYGREPEEIPWLRDAVRAGLGPAAADVHVRGHLTFDDLRVLGRQVTSPAPVPEAHPWPPQIRVLRDPAQPLWNLPAALMEAVWVLDRAGVSLRGAREAVIVIGRVGRLPPPATDTAAVVLLGDGATADYRGYSRIVRFPGAHVPVFRLVIDLPFVLQVGGVRGELGWSFIGCRLRAAAMRRLGGWRSRK
jgi:uncharacterized protein (DUF362 family)